MCTENSEVAISAYPEAQHYFLVRTIRAVCEENRRLVRAGLQQKHYTDQLAGQIREMKERIKELENQVSETLKLC